MKENIHKIFIEILMSNKWKLIFFIFIFESND